MIKNIIKIALVSLLSLTFISCENKYEKNKKEQEEKVKFTPTLPMPKIEDNHINKYFKLSQLYSAKHDPIPAMKIGYAYSEELKDYEKALQWYKYADSMISLGENSYFACYALQKLKRYDEAITWCNKSIELKWDKALVLLGEVYRDNKIYDKAIEFYKKAFEKTEDAQAANNLGYLYSSEIKDYKKAEEWYKKAINLNHYSAYQSLATFYHDDLKDNIKASAYAIALIDTKYTKSSVLKLLQKTWKIPNETIKKGYELQLNSKEFPIKYKGALGLKEK